MFDEELKAIWARAATEDPLSRAEIESLLRPTARRTGASIEFLAWTHVAMLGITVLLSLANLPGYRNNATMFGIECLLGLVSAIFCAWSLWLVAGLKRIARVDQPLLETVELRLSFIERAYEPWLIVASATPWLLTLGINTLIDNQDGNYRVNHPWEFVAITATMFGITYASLRFSTTDAVRDHRAILHDLRGQTLEATQALEPAHRKSLRGLAILVVLLLLAVITSLAVWYSFG